MENQPPSLATDSANLTCDPADIEKNKVFAILAYIGILFIVPLIAAKDSKFAKYHANQGLVLFIVMVILYVALTIISQIPFVGWATLIILPFFPLLTLVLSVLGIVNAAQGQCKPLPVIGQYTLIK